MEPRWKQSTVREKDTTLVWVRQAEKYLTDFKQPVLTSFFPVKTSASCTGRLKWYPHRW